MEAESPHVDQWESTCIPTQLQELLPMAYSYKLKKWTPNESKSNHFEAIILTNVYTEEDAQEWWHEFNVKSNTTMRVRATCPKTGKVNLFKIYLRCLHQGRAEKPDSQHRKSKNSSSLKRNTGCPAGMVIAIRRFVKYSRSKKRDPVDPIHPCEIQIRFVHNHPTNSADSLRFRPVSKEAEDKLLSLYQVGHSPSSALETLKMDLQTEHGTCYSQFATDRYHCPDKSFCFRLYYKHFGKEYASAALKDLSNSLDSKVSEYNAEFGETCMAVERSGTDYAIAVCTPLMKRAHSFQQSSNMVYVELSESPGNKERTEHHVLLLIVHTAAGGVPLGAIVATSNSTHVLGLGFKLLKQLLPEQAFCGRGASGPHSFFIEESENQRIALHSTWPEPFIVLCIFRILQSMWRWLWDEKHNIHIDHRLYLLYLIKTVLYASSEIEMAGKYQALCSDSITAHYPMYLQQVESLWQKRHYWGICFYQLFPLDAASNYYEAAVRALKDRVFEQTKAFNIVQLIHFLLTRLEAFYKSKLCSVLEGGVNHILRSHFSYVIPQTINEGIKQVAGNYFLVPSGLADKMHTVDPELNSCTCSTGITGAFCQHQYWIFLKVPSDMFLVSFMDEEFRKSLNCVIFGTEAHSDPTQCNILAFPIESPSEKNGDASHAESKLLIDEAFTKAHLPQDIPLTDIQVSDVVLSSNVTVASQSDNILSTMSQVSEDVPSNSDPCVLQANVSDTLASSVMSLDPSSPVKADLCKIENDKNDSAKTRMTEVAEKFEHFCQRVKDGLKTQPKDFLPAVEIMMKNLERKGNSSNLLVSGLSFFGVLTETTTKPKERKRPPISKEIVPQIYGRQMITYSKKKKLSETAELSPISELLPATQLHSSTDLHQSTELNSSTELHPSTNLQLSAELQLSPELQASIDLHSSTDLHGSTELLHASTELHPATEFHPSIQLDPDTELNTLQYIRTEFPSAISQEINVNISIDKLPASGNELSV